MSIVIVGRIGDFIMSMFDVFWQNYPKKRSKGDAERAWKKINPDESLLQKMLNALIIAKRSWDWQKDKGLFIPYPATWLRARGWEDEIPKPKPYPAGADKSKFKHEPDRHISENPSLIETIKEFFRIKKEKGLSAAIHWQQEQDKKKTGV